MQPDVSEGDGYTAPLSAVPTRMDADANRMRTLRECFVAFATRLSPRVLAAALVLAIALRIAVGQWSWRDLVAGAALIAFAPFFEWGTHLLVLHARPRKLGRFTLEMPNAKEHRVHHNDPADLDTVLIPSRMLLLNMLVIAGVAAVIGTIVHAVFGASWLPIAASTLVTAYAYLCAYEWMHFLMHSPYKPRTRSFRRVWRNHRLHHYKSEHHWFGVTSSVADVALRTAPDQSTVDRSPTARALHGDDGAH